MYDVGDHHPLFGTVQPTKIFFAITLASSCPHLGFSSKSAAAVSVLVAFDGLPWPSVRRPRRKRKKREAQQPRTGWMRLRSGGWMGGREGGKSMLESSQKNSFCVCFYFLPSDCRAVPSSEQTRIKRQERARPPKSLSLSHLHWNQRRSSSSFFYFLFMFFSQFSE